VEGLLFFGDCGFKSEEVSDWPWRVSAVLTDVAVEFCLYNCVHY
jgi:hypothetical protein